MVFDGLSLDTIQREHATKVLRGLEGIDKTVKEVVNTSEDHRKKIRRRVEDYLRKCPPEELGIVVALCGIKTTVEEGKTKTYGEEPREK
jgi:hypothetical protein